MNTFIHNGRKHMIVTPASTLMRSKTINNVVARGDRFAVDLSTGVFTVIKPDVVTFTISGAKFGNEFTEKAHLHIALSKMINRGTLYPGLRVGMALNGEDIGGVVYSRRDDNDSFLARVNNLLGGV